MATEISHVTESSTLVTRCVIPTFVLREF